jgi:hypothetical protein
VGCRDISIRFSCSSFFVRLFDQLAQVHDRYYSCRLSDLHKNWIEISRQPAEKIAESSVTAVFDNEGYYFKIKNLIYWVQKQTYGRK